jgi:hypothetical protein
LRAMNGETPASVPFLNLQEWTLNCCTDTRNPSRMPLTNQAPPSWHPSEPANDFSSSPRTATRTVTRVSRWTTTVPPHDVPATPNTPAIPTPLLSATTAVPCNGARPPAPRGGAGAPPPPAATAAQCNGAKPLTPRADAAATSGAPHGNRGGKGLPGWEGVAGWTTEQQLALRAALAEVPQGTAGDATAEYWARMERVARRVPGKSAAECARAARTVAAARRGCPEAFYASAFYGARGGGGGGGGGAGA